MQIPTEAQIVENLSPCYRSIFGKIKRQKVYSGEKIFYAADFTGNGTPGLMDWGFMIFTTHRYLKIFMLSENLSGISYYKLGSNWDKILGEKVVDRRWMDPYKAYKESYLAKLELPKCSDFDYSTIKGVIRNDYSVQSKSRQIPLVELRLDFYDRFGDIFKTFKAKDGTFIYDLLNFAIRNGGKLSTQSTEKERGVTIQKLSV